MRARGQRIVLVGWGAIGQRVAALLDQRGNGGWIVGVGLRGPRAGLPASPITDPGALAALAPDLVVEAAGRDAVLPWARAGFSCGADVAVLSTSALTGDGVLDDLMDRAGAAGKSLLIPPGALGGIDALSAASRLGLTKAEHRIVKPARAWRGTAAETLCDLGALTEPVTFFSGPAREAAARFPQNANVAVISALAGIGLDRTSVSLVADPAISLNTHVLIAEGDSGRIEICLENRPLRDNPKSSEMTALSLVRLIENRTATLVI